MYLTLSFFFRLGDRNKGWYYGENIRTGKRGWFPLAYTEQVKDVDVDSGYRTNYCLSFLFLGAKSNLFKRILGSNSSVITIMLCAAAFFPSLFPSVVTKKNLLSSAIYLFLFCFIFFCFMQLYLRSLGLRSQFDSSLITSPDGVATTANIDAESTTSGNSSASHSSSGPTISHGMAPPLHPPAPPSALMKPSFARSLLPGQLIQQKQQQQQEQQQPSSSPQQPTSSALRPTSLLGDRTLFNKAPFSGFGKVYLESNLVSYYCALSHGHNFYLELFTL